MIIFCLLAVLSASLLLSEWGWRYSSIANFYLLPTRAWELLLGSLGAVYVSRFKPNANGYLSSFGLVLIIFSIFLFDKSIPIPSVYALLPTTGTLFVLVYAENTHVAKVLSSKMLVGVGLISYSAYLYHQPIFALYRARSLNAPDEFETLAIICLVLVISVLSFFLVEKNFRNYNKLANKSVIYVLAILSVLVFSLVLQGSSSQVIFQALHRCWTQWRKLIMIFGCPIVICWVRKKYHFSP